MAFVDLSQHPQELHRIFRTLGLAQGDETIAASPLEGGVSSGIYRVRLRSGDYCVKQALPRLKVAKEWKVPVGRAAHEYEWLRTAAAIVPGHVPRVLGFDDRTTSFVMEDLGEQHRPWKADLLAGQVDVGLAGRLGEIVARLHAGTAGRAEIHQRFDTSSNFHAIRLEPYLGEAARMHPGVADVLQQLIARTAATRLVLVHGDVSPKNVLVGPRAPVLLDAECAWYGDPAFDVAFCLNHFLLKAAHLPLQRTSLMQCFAAFASSYSLGVSWEPWPALQARIASLLPGLGLARIDGKSPVEYLLEPMREKVRRTTIALLMERPAELEHVARRWQEGVAT